MKGSIAVVLNYPLQNQIEIGHLDLLKIQWENMLKLFDEVHVISPRDSRKYDLENKKIKVHSIPAPISYFSIPKEIKFLKNLISQKDIHLIRALAPSSGFVAVKAAGGKIPVVVSVHAHRRLVEKTEGSRVFKDFLIDMIEPKVYKSATLIPVISKFIKKYVSDMGVPPEKIFLHNNFVDTKLFKPKKKKNMITTLFWAGRLTPVKGVDLLIRTLPLILKHQKAVLQIAGVGPEEEKLRHLVYKYGIKDYVEFLGSLDHQKQLPEAMASADIFISPALSGFTLIEAMSCGLPVVAADIEWTSEVIMNNKTGILVMPNSAEELAKGVVKLLQDNTLAAQLGKNARKIAEAQFSLEAWEKRELEIYEKALSEFKR